MKIKIVRFPYMDYEVGDVVDLGEEQNRSLVEDFQRAVWVEKEKKKKPRKKAVKTTTQVEDDESESEDSSPVRGADGRFVSKKKEEETEKPKKRGFLGKLR